MVAQPGAYQASHNAGELAPELHGRTDIKQFYSGLALMVNVEPVPQGGARLSMRSRHFGRVRNAILSFATADSLMLGPFSAAGVVYTLAFAAQPLSMAVLHSIRASQAVGNILQIEYELGDGWHAVGPTFGAGVDLQTRTSAFPPGTQATGCTGVRLRLTSAPPAGTTFEIASFAAYEETSTISEVRYEPFSFALDQTYVACFVLDVVDFWRDGVYVGTAFTTAGIGQVRRFDITQRLDTMLVFDLALQLRIVRDGADNRWVTDAIPFAEIPQVDLGGTYTVTMDQWSVFLDYPTTGPFAAGVSLILAFSVDGVETRAITTGNPVNWTTVAADIAAALADLPAVGGDVDVTPFVTTGQTQFVITFNSLADAGLSFSLSARVINTTLASSVEAHDVIGDLGGEDLFGATAGYPRCAAFYQDRLIMGGFAAKPGALLASITSEYFTLNITLPTASGAILVNIDTDGSEAVQRLVRATHLVIFTSDAEYFVSDRVLARGQGPNIVESTRHGIVPGVPVVQSEGKLIYVGADKQTDVRKGVLLYSAEYDDVAQKYVSQPLSLLASHIVNDVTDAALQKFGDANSADRLWMVRGDGSMTCAVMIRNQDVVAFTRWQTDGAVRAACVDGRNRVYLAVQRVVGGIPQMHFERLEDGLIFDDVVDIVNTPASVTVTGLQAHEGAIVWALADGFVEGPFTVVAATITLPFPATNISVGRWKQPVAITLPLPNEVAQGVVLRRPKRVHTVKIDLVNTTALAIGANDAPAEDVGLYTAGMATDTPLPGFTGMQTVTGLFGFTDAGQVTITQLRPGRLQWRGLTIEARI